jgi:hypothetical protein
MKSIRISKNCLDKEFLIAGHLTRQEFNTTLYHLFFFDIQLGEMLADITFVLDITWKISQKCLYGLNSGFFEFFDIDIRRMQERFGEKHPKSI